MIMFILNDINYGFLNIIEFVLSIIIVLYLFTRYKTDFKEEFIVFKNNKLKYFLLGLLGFILIFIFDEISYLILDKLNLNFASDNQEEIDNAVKSNFGFLVIIGAILLTPIIEEVLFRKIIFKIIKTEYIAFIVSSLVFGLAHVITEPSFKLFIINSVSYIFAGAVFCYVYLKSNKNIYVPILSHLSVNLVYSIMNYFV